MPCSSDASLPQGKGLQAGGWRKLLYPEDHLEGRGGWVCSLARRLAGCLQNRAKITHEGLGAQELVVFPLNRHRLSVKILKHLTFQKSISGRAGGRSLPFL